jgi:hypothetical protein
MNYGITLTPEFQTYQAGNIDGFRMRVTASDGLNMPNEVFRYRAIPLQPNSLNDEEEEVESEQWGVFDGVCSPADLEEFPINEPYTTADPPWFRLAYVDLVFRSRHELEEAYRTLVDEVSALRDTIKLMEDLSEEDEVRIGDAA